MKRSALIIAATCAAIISAAVVVVRSDAYAPGRPTGTLSWCHSTARRALRSWTTRRAGESARETCS